MIREAGTDDIFEIARLVSDFYLEAPYDAPQVDIEKASYVLNAVVKAETAFVWVAVDDDNRVTGVLIAERREDLWSDAYITVEHIFYVTPLARGGGDGGALLNEFRVWSELVPGAVRVEASSGIGDERVYALYEKLGWTERGRLYGKEVF